MKYTLGVEVTGGLLHSWLCDLFPLSRSVVGPGITQSLNYLRKVIDLPSNMLSYPSGSIHSGWKVPKGWKLNTARIEDMDGNVIVSTEKSNLHLWSHSVPFRGVVSRQNLEDHLLTLQDLPDAIPYATTYYRENWGFSLAYNTYQKLTDKEYRIFVDTELNDDTLNILEIVIEGRYKEEILFSTYLCHPSMANNELSGPVLAAGLMKYLKNRDNNYTYRFLIGPETIGPICYLSDHLNELKNRVVAAFNLTCVGGGDEWSLLKSPNGNTFSDKIASHLLLKKIKVFTSYDFVARGSDERQYCSPNVRLPMVSVMRSKYHEYREYHNSLDDCEFVTPKRLQESFDFYVDLIDLIDSEGLLLSTTIGEPFLSDLFDYPSIGGRIVGQSSDDYRIANQLIAFADGTTLLEIAERLNLSALDLLAVLEKCLNLGLIERKPLPVIIDSIQEWN